MKSPIIICHGFKDASYSFSFQFSITLRVSIIFFALSFFSYYIANLIKFDTFPKLFKKEIWKNKIADLLRFVASTIFTYVQYLVIVNWTVLSRSTVLSSKSLEEIFSSFVFQFCKSFCNSRPVSSIYLKFISNSS